MYHIITPLTCTFAVGSTKRMGGVPGGVGIHAVRATDVERTVEIPRRVAEEMLVKHYKEVLEGLPDGEVARLFEEEIVSEGLEDKKVDGRGAVKDFPVDGRGVMKDFPVDVLGQKVVEEQEGGLEKGDETSRLLSQQSEGQGAVVPEYWDAGGFLSVDPKDVALPVMGVGVVVIGVALMYKLISTLSSSGNGSTPVKSAVDKAALDPHGGDARNVVLGGQSGGDPNPAVHAQGENAGKGGAPPSSPGGILWQRKETSPTVMDVVTSNETNDLWRVPMNDLKRNDGMMEEYNGLTLGDQQVSGRNVQESRRDGSEIINTPLESKRGLEKTKILDNAESIAVPHPYSQRLQRMQPRRPSSQSS